MSLSLTDLDYLTSAAGERLLTALAAQDLGEAHTLKLISTLRKDHTPEQARAALSMARLRQKALAKFGVAASRLFFTEAALQQASDPHIRAYRAAHLPAGASVLDVCCGIGADALAFAGRGGPVLGLDIDPVRVAIARHNAAALGLDALAFQMVDVTQGLPPHPHPHLLFYDPARRDAQGRRIHDVRRYLPPLDLVRGWQAENMMVKLSPGVDLSQLAGYDGQVEFISVNGDLKEALLHLGAAGSAPPKATLITNRASTDAASTDTAIADDAIIDAVLHHWARAEGESPPKVATSPPRAWLIEPDPALIRAGLVQDAAQAYAGWLLDERIAYFTADAVPDTPWVRAWRVLDWMPFHLKKLRAYLRGRGVGQLTVKKRGSPLTPESLIPKLNLKGENTCTLVLTRYEDQPIVIICVDYQQGEGVTSA